MINLLPKIYGIDEHWWGVGLEVREEDPPGQMEEISNGIVDPSHHDQLPKM